MSSHSTTLLHGLKYPVDLGSNWSAGYESNLALLDPNRIMSDVIANRPASSKNRRFFFSTDEYNLYFDNGTNWMGLFAPYSGTGADVMFNSILIGGSTSYNRSLVISGYPSTIVQGAGAAVLGWGQFIEIVDDSLKIIKYTSADLSTWNERFRIDTNGDLTIAGDFRVNGNQIKDYNGVDRLSLGAVNALTGALTVSSYLRLDNGQIRDVGNSNRIIFNTGSTTVLSDFDTTRLTLGPVNALTGALTVSSYVQVGASGIRDASSNPRLALGTTNTFTGDLSTTGDLRAAGDLFVDGNKVFINEATDTSITVGLCINQGTNDNNIMTFKSNVSHGLTTITETDTYGFFKKAGSSTGGLTIYGISDANSTSMNFESVIGSVSPTTPCFKLRGRKTNGTTGVQNLTATEALFRLDNGSDTGMFTVMGDGALVTGGLAIPGGTGGSIHAYTGTSGAVASSFAYDIITESAGGGGITILTPAANIGQLIFGSPTSNVAGVVRYDHSINALQFFTSATQRGYFGLGFVVGSPTSGDVGIGMINAVEVRDDGILLTGYVVEAAVNNDIDLDFWDKKSKGTHTRARAFKSRNYDDLDLDKFSNFWKENLYLSSLFNDRELNHNELSIGTIINGLWETVEVQAVHINKLNERLKRLER